jgi:RHS repeat-associated protein
MHHRLVFLSGVLLLFVLSITFISFITERPIVETTGKATNPVLPAKTTSDGTQVPFTSTGTTTYVYGSKLIAKKDTTTTYNFQDLIGSNTITTDDRGAIKSRYSSYPYGKILKKESTSSGQQKYTYTGKEDDGKLMYYGARYMDPRTGRFTSTDPAQSTFASYDYAAENPLTITDPTGKANYYYMIRGMGPAEYEARVQGIPWNPSTSERLAPERADMFPAFQLNAIGKPGFDTNEIIMSETMAQGAKYAHYGGFAASGIDPLDFRQTSAAKKAGMTVADGYLAVFRSTEQLPVSEFHYNAKYSVEYRNSIGSFDESMYLDRAPFSRVVKLNPSTEMIGAIPISEFASYPGTKELGNQIASIAKGALRGSAEIAVGGIGGFGIDIAYINAMLNAASNSGISINPLDSNIDPRYDAYAARRRSTVTIGPITMVNSRTPFPITYQDQSHSENWMKTYTPG